MAFLMKSTKHLRKTFPRFSKNSSRVLGWGENFPTHLVNPGGPDEDLKRKGNYEPISPMTTDTKLLTKTLVIQTQQYI